MTKENLIRRIKEMEQRVKDRTYYGKVSEYNCEISQLKYKLQNILDSEINTIGMDRLSIL